MRKKLVIPAVFILALSAQNDGLVKTYYPSKALKTEGNYTNGVRDGLWTFWYEGEVFQDFGYDRLPNTNDLGEGNGLWDSDTAQGLSELVLRDLNGDSLFDPPYKKMEGSYSNGNKEATWTSWYLNEMRKDESNYSSGKLNGSIIKWFENGTKSEEGIYEDGKQNGNWVWYYETGIKKEETKFLDGQQEGIWTQWFPDGTKKSERYFSNGERDNIWTSWYDNSIFISKRKT